MIEVFSIATNVSTPLMVAGFLAGAFFLILRYILKKDIFPTLSRQLSSEIIKLTIERLFTLSLIALVLGFSGFALTVFKGNTAVDLEAKEATIEPAYYIVAWSVESVSEAKEKVSQAKERGYKNAYYILKDGSKKIAIVIEDHVLKEQIPYSIGAAKNAGLPRDTYSWPMNYVSGAKSQK